MDLGMKIRETREKIGMSLRKLAKEVGVSPSFISQVEQNKAQPSINSLQKIAQVLGISIATLMGEKNIATRAKKKVDFSQFSGVEVKRLVPNSANLEPCLFTLKPGSTSGEILTTNTGEEFVLLLNGSMELSLDGKTYELKEGDNIYFNSSVPHSFRNISNSPAKVLWVKNA
jgi:transcriptional regulator with XRE-family HTH domain